MSQISPFPIPFGWFQVAFSADLGPGHVVPLECFGRHLVLWRDDAGVAHVNDAFCPHLGAHFGFGGHVAGDELVCPFHGWRFDAEGRNTLIPYSQRLNRKACVATFPVAEVNGLVMAWFHPVGAAPMWDIPEVAEFNDPDRFTAPVTRDYVVHAPWQDLAENGVDAAHFRYVHHTAEVPVLESYETDGPFSSMRSVQRFPTPRGVVDGRIDADSFGPGFSVVRFSGIVDTVLMGTTTPLDENSCRMRFTFTVRRAGDDTLDSNVGDAFVAEIDRQVRQDTPIWENKAYLVRPALADTDGPFTRFRRWAAQFYAEGVDSSQLRYEPAELFHHDTVETAAQRLGASQSTSDGDPN